MKRIKLNQTKDKTFEEGLQEYIENCKARNLREKTIIHYYESFKCIFKVIPSDMKISTISQHTFDNFVIEYKKRFNVKDITLYTYSRDLKVLLYFFMKNGWMKEFKISLIKANKEPVETYNDKELEALLKKPNLKKCSFAEYRNWVIVNLLLSTGLRVNSFVNLKVSDIDFDNSLLSVRVTKNRKVLIVPLNNTIIKILKQYILLSNRKDNDLLFCTVYGKILNRKTIYHSLAEYSHNRGVIKTGIHRFRHTFAKKWISAGGNVVTLSKILGHSNLAITENYINMLNSDLVKDVNTFNILDEFKKQHIKINK